MNSNKLDTTIFDRYVREIELTAKHQPVVMLASRTGKPFLVRCSNKANPACWSIVENLFDVTFLSRKDLEDFIIRNNLREWTEEDDRRYHRKLSNYCHNHCRVEY